MKECYMEISVYMNPIRAGIHHECDKILWDSIGDRVLDLRRVF